MADNGEKPERQVPEFKPSSFWAFMTLTLYKLGGVEVITDEQLEQFDIEHAPDVLYDHDRKAWIMKLKKDDMPKRILVPVNGKILKKQRRLIKGFLS